MVAIDDAANDDAVIDDAVFNDELKPVSNPMTALNLTPGFGTYGANRPARDAHRARRFVTQSHALGAPTARPGPLLIAATVVVAVVLIARRLID